jgi:hypothetical protein
MIFIMFADLYDIENLAFVDDLMAFVDDLPAFVNPGIFQAGQVP